MKLGLLLVLICLLVASHATAQSRPLPGSAVVQQQEEVEEQSSQVKLPEAGTEPEEGSGDPGGFVRVWLGGLPSEMSYAIGLIPHDAQAAGGGENEINDFVWLSRGVRTADLRDYLEVPVGVYNVVILTEKVEQFTADASLFRLPAWRDIKFRSQEPIRVTAGGIQTLLIVSRGGKVQTIVLKDRHQSDGPRRIRVVNLTEGRTGTLTLVSGGGEEVVARTLPALNDEFVLPANLRRVSYRGEFPGSKPESMVQQVFDVDHGIHPAYTFVVFVDRYGRVTGRMLPDKTSLN